MKTGSPVDPAGGMSRTAAQGPAGGGRAIGVLLACLVVVMIGFGVTLPVLPFYVERVLQPGGSGERDVAMEVGLLTGAYPLMQLVAAPLWGRWSDSVGRRRLVLVGIGGAAAAQALFAVATTREMLYLTRVVGGLLSSAILPAAAAYVTDITTPRGRARGMAWLGSAVSLGVVIGPALGGVLVRGDLDWRLAGWHVVLPSFSVPFLASAALSLLALGGAARWLPESRPEPVLRAGDDTASLRRLLARTDLRPLLALATGAQFGLAMFETTFALYASRMWNFGPAEVGIVFMVCGLVMALSQTGTVVLLSRYVSESLQMAAGFTVMGLSLAALLTTRTTPAILATVAALALGTALISPNLTALISKRGEGRAGAALGAQNAANSLGQLGGVLGGTVLFGWNMGAPFSLAGGLLVAVGAVLAWRARRESPAPPAGFAG